MQEHSAKISLKEEVGLIETIQELFALEEIPRIALVNDLTIKLGKFRDVVAYSRIPYFIRIDQETGMTVFSKKEENHTYIRHPLSVEDQGDLYGFLVENQEFADDKIKSDSLGIVNPFFEKELYHR